MSLFAAIVSPYQTTRATVRSSVVALVIQLLRQCASSGGQQPTITGPGESNRAKAQDKDYKITTRNMFKDLNQGKKQFILMKTVMTQTIERKHPRHESRL